MHACACLLLQYLLCTDLQPLLESDSPATVPRRNVVALDEACVRANIVTPRENDDTHEAVALGAPQRRVAHRFVRVWVHRAWTMAAVGICNDVVCVCVCVCMRV